MKLPTKLRDGSFASITISSEHKNARRNSIMAPINRYSRDFNDSSQILYNTQFQNTQIPLLKASKTTKYNWKKSVEKSYEVNTSKCLMANMISPRNTKRHTVAGFGDTSSKKFHFNLDSCDSYFDTDTPSKVVYDGYKSLIKELNSHSKRNTSLSKLSKSPLRLQVKLPKSKLIEAMASITCRFDKHRMKTLENHNLDKSYNDFCNYCSYQINLEASSLLIIVNDQAETKVCIDMNDKQTTDSGYVSISAAYVNGLNMILNASYTLPTFSINYIHAAKPYNLHLQSVSGKSYVKNISATPGLLRTYRIATVINNQRTKYYNKLCYDKAIMRTIRTLYAESSDNNKKLCILHCLNFLYSSESDLYAQQPRVLILGRESDNLSLHTHTLYNLSHENTFPSYVQLNPTKQYRSGLTALQMLPNTIGFTCIPNKIKSKLIFDGVDDVEKCHYFLGATSNNLYNIDSEDFQMYKYYLKLLSDTLKIKNVAFLEKIILQGDCNSKILDSMYRYLSAGSIFQMSHEHCSINLINIIVDLYSINTVIVINEERLYNQLSESYKEKKISVVFSPPIFTNINTNTIVNETHIWREYFEKENNCMVTQVPFKCLRIIGNPPNNQADIISQILAFVCCSNESEARARPIHGFVYILDVNEDSIVHMEIPYISQIHAADAIYTVEQYISEHIFFISGLHKLYATFP